MDWGSAVTLAALRAIWRNSRSGGAPVDQWGQPAARHPGWTWLIQERPGGSLDFRGEEGESSEEDFDLLTLTQAAPRLSGCEVIMVHLRWSRGGDFVDGAFVDLGATPNRIRR